MIETILQKFILQAIKLKTIKNYSNEIFYIFKLLKILDIKLELKQQIIDFVFDKIQNQNEILNLYSFYSYIID